MLVSEINKYRRSDGFIDLSRIEELPKPITEEIYKNYWYLFDDKRILFKKSDNNLAHIGEMIIQEFCKELNIKCAKFDLAIIKGNYIGVISYDFLKKNEILFLGKELLETKEIINLTNEEFIGKKNVLAIIKMALSLFDETKSNLLNIMDNIYKMYLLDIFTYQIDRHPSNWGLIYNGVICIYAPLFDNGHVFNFQWSLNDYKSIIKNKPLLKEISTKTINLLTFNINSNSALEDFSYFCLEERKEAKSFCELLFKINIDIIIKNIYDEYGFIIPKYISEWLKILIEQRKEDMYKVLNYKS